MKRLLLSLTAAAFLASAVPAAASGSTLEGWWGFNELRNSQAAWDWSGNGNHGQLGSTPGRDDNDPTRIWGAFLGGLHFDGNDFVRIPAAPELEPANVTVATFIRSATPLEPYNYVFSKGASDCDAGSYGLYTDSDGDLAFYIGAGEEYAISPQAAPEIWNGRWHFVAGTFDGQTVRLFVDGREVGTGTATDLQIGYGLANGGDGYIGAYRGSCDLFMTGDLDEVMVWSRAIPFGQIGQRFNEVLSGR
jgi:hypothetical protein